MLMITTSHSVLVSALLKVSTALRTVLSKPSAVELHTHRMLTWFGVRRVPLISVLLANLHKQYWLRTLVNCCHTIVHLRSTGRRTCQIHKSQASRTTCLH